MKRLTAFPVILVALLCAHHTALAQEIDPALEGLLKKGAMALLQETDVRHNPFKDQTITTKMIMHGGTNDGNEFVFKTITKGANLRAIRFDSPADMRGMGLVIKGRDEIYARLPDSDRVRRVGSHAKRQSFQGSDWNFDDMSMIYLAEDFTPEITDDNATHVVMTLTRNSGVDLQYPKVVIAIDKRYIMIDRLEYFNESGKLVKVQERYDPKKMGGDHYMYTRVTMTDLGNKHMTENLVLEELVNQNVSDDTFSRRWLVRGL